MINNYKWFVVPMNQADDPYHSGHHSDTPPHEGGVLKYSCARGAELLDLAALQACIDKRDRLF